MPVDIPFRSQYYGIGICLNGTAELQANLENFRLRRNWVVAMSPDVIKQWRHRSADFDTLTVFFTKTFLDATTVNLLSGFSFLDSPLGYAFEVEENVRKQICNTLHHIREQHQSAGDYRAHILQHLICVLLYEIAEFYDNSIFITKRYQNRAQLLSANFKILVSKYCRQERRLSFYSEKLAITSKYLIETVKAVTGKTPGFLINEALTLEAKILLQNPEYSISQVAAQLNFPDQSTFGKFFKKISMLSPSEFRKLL